MKKRDCVRFRVSVPDDDKATLAWLRNQHTVSLSLRTIIKEAIATHGMGDLFSSELPTEEAQVSEPAVVTESSTEPASSDWMDTISIGSGGNVSDLSSMLNN